MTPERETGTPRRVYPLAHLRSLPDGSLTATEVGLLCDEIEKLSTMVDEWDYFRDEAFLDDYFLREKLLTEIERLKRGYERWSAFMS